jgi:hypothetical protein
MASKQLGIGTCVGFLLGCGAGAWGLSLATPPRVPAAVAPLVAVALPDAEGEPLAAPPAVPQITEENRSNAEGNRKQREPNHRGPNQRVDPRGRPIPILPDSARLRQGVRIPGGGCQGEIPSTWSRHKFNGREYYIIPLAGK